MPPSQRDGSSTVLKPTKRVKLADLAHEAIREAIIDGRYRMGERLVETKLASELNMSRAPLREALRQLVDEGLLEERPHQGIFVSTLSGQDITDLYNVRIPLEVAAVRLCVRRGAPTKALWRALDRMSPVVSDPRAYLREDLAFHTEICRGSGNELLHTMHERIAARLILVLADQAFSDADQVTGLHAAIIEEMEAGDEDAAVQALIDSFGNIPKEAVEKAGGDPSLLLVLTTA